MRSAKFGNHLCDLRLDGIKFLLLLIRKLIVTAECIRTAAIDLDKLFRREALFLRNKTCAESEVFLRRSIVVSEIMAG